MENTRKKHSMHIDHDHYEDHAIRDLRFCVADARKESPCPPACEL